MKKYNIVFFACTLAILFLSLQKANAQVKIYEEGSYVKVELTEEQKDEIMLSTTKIVNDYARVATFRDDNNNFSDQSYAEFVGLFAGSAEVYDDLAKKDGGNINYATYADKVFQYLRGTGVKFELNNTYLDEIDYDSSGFYKITVSFEKVMFNGLSDDNELINFPNNGKPVELKMTIEVPEYDLSQATILNVLGEAVKVKVESASMISTDLNYHLGSVSKTAGDASPGFSSDMPLTYNSYGVDVVYRRSMNSKKSLYLLAGLSAGFHNFTSDLSGTAAQSPGSLGILIGGVAIDQTSANPVPSSKVAILEVIESPNNSLTEKLQIIDLQIPIGASFRLVENYNWDIFLDVAVVPTYSIVSTGSYSGKLDYFKLPEDRTFFDQSYEDHLRAEFKDDPNNANPEYFGNTEFGNELAETTPHFSAAAQITPLFHYKFNFRMALEVGANVSYGFLPYFANETNHLGDDLSEILNISDQAGAQNPSILQNNFKNVSILRYGARVGLVFKL